MLLVCIEIDQIRWMDLSQIQIPKKSNFGGGMERVPVNHSHGYKCFINNRSANNKPLLNFPRFICLSFAPRGLIFLLDQVNSLNFMFDDTQDQNGLETVYWLPCRRC